MKAIEVYNGSDGNVTTEYYKQLQAKGPSGELAAALFRAQKRSSAAKRYPRKYSEKAYSVKNWSISEVCRLLKGTTTFRWGWKEDLKCKGFPWVLYVDLPCGQVSFHTASRLEGPDYPGEWDRQHQAPQRIMRFCDFIMGEKHTLACVAGRIPNFGKRCNLPKICQHESLFSEGINERPIEPSTS